MKDGSAYACDALDRWLMSRALEQARAAADGGEAPVGAVVFDPGCVGDVAAGRASEAGEVDEAAWAQGVVAVGGNSSISSHDPTGHAEIVALRAAALARGNYRLTGLWLAVTLEPCAMCAGALSHARIGRVVFGASDPKGGAVAHGPRLFELPTIHWRPDVVGGVMADECGQILRDFFRARRGHL